MAEEVKGLLKPCKNLRTSNVKNGNLIARIRKDLKIISSTYFASFNGCEKGHFLADSYGTVEINLGDSNSISDEWEIPVRRWSAEVLPQIPYFKSKKYKGISEVYCGNIEEVLEAINSLDIESVDKINSCFLPISLL